jgi:hypothetical protein
MRNVPSSALSRFNARTAAARSDIAILRPTSNTQTLKILNTQKSQHSTDLRANTQTLKSSNIQTLNISISQHLNTQISDDQKRKNPGGSLPLALSRVRERYSKPPAKPPSVPPTGGGLGYGRHHDGEQLAAIPENCSDKTAP